MSKSIKLTKDPIWFLLRKVTIPASVGSLFQTFYNLVDTWFAGKISAEAIGAIAKSFPIYFTIIAVGVGLGAATNALIGNSIGEKKERIASMYVAQSLIFALVISIIVTLFGLNASNYLLEVMGSDTNSIILTREYLDIIFYGTFILRLFLLCLLAFLSQYIFLIYKLDNNSINIFIYYVLGVEYVLAGIILTYGIVLRLEKNTHKMLIIGLVRFALELILIYLLLFEYGIIAAAIILFISRYAETILAYIFVKKQNLLKSSGLILATFIFPMAFFIANF